MIRIRENNDNAADAVEKIYQGVWLARLNGGRSRTIGKTAGTRCRKIRKNKIIVH